MFKATDIREWRGLDIVVAEGHKVGELGAGSRSCPWTRQQSVPGQGRLRQEASEGRPSIVIYGELSAGDEEKAAAIFRHYGLTYQAGAGGERRLARR